MSTRVDVRKTYKQFVGGKFPRSEYGRTYEITTAEGTFAANAALASRKDARDAVRAARAAQPGWAGATAYNRGQVLYRVAELLEERRDQFASQVRAGEGVSSKRAEDLVSAAIDRWVWYAGWSDKIAQVGGNANPVAGPFFNISTPEPTGVVGAIAPQRSSLLGLVSVLAPVIVTGNAAVVLASADRPLPAVTLAEVLATSDVPGGVVNILTGHTAEVAPHLATHADVNAIDVSGAVGAEGITWGELEEAAAETLKRVRRPLTDDEPDYAEEQSLSQLLAFTEVKTVWHPKGA